MPSAFVSAVVVLVPLAKVPLGPVLGAVNVTVTPPSGSEWLSSTVACRRVGNCVLMATLWGVPADAIIDAGVPAVFVKLKFAGVATPDTVAATVYGPPGRLLAVKVGAVAMPLELVVAG